MKKIITPAGEIEITSKHMIDFFEQVPKTTGHIKRPSKYVENGYHYEWTYEDGVLKTKITKQVQAKNKTQKGA